MDRGGRGVPSRGATSHTDPAPIRSSEPTHTSRHDRSRRPSVTRPPSLYRRPAPPTCTAACTAVVTVPPLPQCRRRFREAQNRNALLRSACPRPVPPGGPEARRFADRLHPRRLGVRHAHIGVRGLPAPPGGPVAAVPRGRRARRRMRHRPVLRAGAQPGRGGGRGRRRRRLARDARHGRPPGGRPWMAQRPARAGADRGGRAARRRGPRHVLRHPRRAAVHGGPGQRPLARPRRGHGGRGRRQVGAGLGAGPERRHPRAALALRARLRRLRPPLDAPRRRG